MIEENRRSLKHSPELIHQYRLSPYFAAICLLGILVTGRKEVALIAESKIYKGHQLRWIQDNISKKN